MRPLTALARRRLPVLVVVGVALVASLPLLRPGLPDTHDGLFHYYRLAALDEAIRAGCLYPRWFPDFAFGYGQPVLLFYGPASYYAAELFRLLGASYLAATKLSLLAASVVAGCSAYGLARVFVRPWAAALAGAAYVLTPYRLANVYVRGAFAEAWGLALLPLLLLITERAVRKRDATGYVALATVWAVVVLTHNLTALIAAPVWLVYVLYRCGLSSRPLAPLVGAGVAAAGLTAFFWLPIVKATPLVGLGNTFSTDAWQRYLTGPADTVSLRLVYGYFPEQGVAHQYPIGLVHLMTLLASLVASWSGRRQAERARLVGLAVALLLGAWLMQCSVSVPVWQYVPVVGYLQFPWRLMAVFWLGWSLALAAGGEAVMARRPRGPAPAVVTLVGAATLALAGMLGLPSETVSTGGDHDWRAHMWSHDAAIGQVGATWTAEYVPIWVTVDRSAMPSGPVETDRPPDYALAPGTSLDVVSVGYYRATYQVSASESARLTLHGFYFPGWAATVDGVAAAVTPYTDLGLLSLEVPAGEHRVQVLLGEPPLGRVGRAISVVHVVGLVAVAIARPRRMARQCTSTPRLVVWARPVVASLAAGVVAWLLLGCHEVERPVNALWAPFEDRLALAGWSSGREAVVAGGTLDVTLHWLALATPAEDYKVYVHLVAADGTVVAQSDGDPVGGYTPARRLVGGEVLTDERSLVVPADARPGQYTLYAGLYRWPEVINLKVASGEQAGVERVTLGSIEVVP